MSRTPTRDFQADTGDFCGGSFRRVSPPISAATRVFAAHSAVACYGRRR